MCYFSLNIKEVPAICALPGPACLKSALQETSLCSLSFGFSVGVASGRHKQGAGSKEG